METKHNRILSFLGLFPRSFRELKRNDPLRMAGATAFFTTFALPPILIILFQVFSLFLSRKMVGSQLMEVMSSTLGQAGAEQIRQTTRGFRMLITNWYISVILFVFLLFVATTLFVVVKNTLNDIWQVRIKEKPGIFFGLKNRARSFAAIILAGIFFMASIVIDSFEVFAGKYMTRIWPGGGQYFSGILNDLLGAVVVSIWFTILFRYLANAHPSWKVSMVGGVITGVLFSIGKNILAALMRNSNLDNIYGTSASIVLILLFVFYSSFILYFGACFIKVYSDEIQDPLRTARKAYRFHFAELKEKA
ncbi:YihY/virulence factor BrkB family protein [Terrimonas sp. NA20]|uniref:YihY/virulence factor BrkB family protein n=1 Tax=Terrimonas ginsenosidimutans TaxID=2908004 RepID=A0ABS9KL15_9BACT|nr:YihY/virulence factor BrkB family protein [Terrimonas ginsenosidimutans]MCG2613015.1 YihY/virulence factor BrkB family protein [Terrimonas ginsenosidimutans]